MKIIEHKKDITNLKTLINAKNIKNEPVLLHLGAGSQLLEGYINIDINDHTITDFVLDLRDMALPIECIDAIQIHHVFEHFTEYEGELLLNKWFLWLKKKGTLTVSVPDLECCLTKYCANTYSFEMLLNQIYRGRCRDNKETDSSKEWRDANTHKFGYSPTTLAQCLSTAGFNTVKQVAPPANRQDNGITITYKATK